MPLSFMPGTATIKLENQRFLVEQQIKDFESKGDRLHLENEELMKQRDAFKTELDKTRIHLAVAEATRILAAENSTAKIFQLLEARKPNKSNPNKMIAELFK